MKMQTYKIQFRLASFDDVRTIKILAFNEAEAKRTARLSEGRIAIVSCEVEGPFASA